MYDIEDFGEHFTNHLLKMAEDAVRRDHAGQQNIPRFEDLVGEKMISMIEYVIENAAKNA
jgi:hypothetical protein